MDGALAQQIEQGSHVRLELFGVRHAAIGDSVPHRASVTEEEAQPVPRLQPGKAEARGEQAFTPNRHCLRPIAYKQAPLREGGERAAEMGATDRIECGVDAIASLAP